MPGARAVIVALGLAAASCAPSGTDRTAPEQPRPTAFTWQLPPGLPTPAVPASNPMTLPRVELGRRLFHDPRLSRTGTMSCASCHQQTRAFTDGRAHAVGATGEVHERNTMSLTNVAYNASYGWSDPSVSSLEEQMLVPMFNDHPIELGIVGHEQEIVRRFAGDAGERARFAAAFPGEADPVHLPNIVKAIAAFERTLISGDSPFDRYLYRDDKQAIPEAARRGMTLFFSRRLRCAECHASFNLSGPVVFAGQRKPAPLLFHNTALYDVDGRGAYPANDRGLFDRTRRPADMGRFRAPTLRNVAVTGPYMHDGSVPTLEAAIDHYASGGKASRFRSDRIRGFTLDDAGRADLLAFLESLTDRGFLTNPGFGPPDGRAAEPAKTAAVRLNGHDRGRSPR
jgi:cytochrome c peroxidase